MTKAIDTASRLMGAEECTPKDGIGTPVRTRNRHSVRALSEMRPLFATLFLVATRVHPGAVAERAPLPNRPESLKFAVIGDNGTGDRCA